MKFLAGDIGGTKTVVAIYDSENGPSTPLTETTFASADYPSLETIIQTFFAQEQITGADFVSATFGVAGPVVSGRANITNLPWQMDEKQLSTTLGLQQVSLINDLVAIATAVPGLPESDLHTINPGSPQPNGPIAVVAPGTGLGEAYLVHDGHRYRALPSEGGHASFGPTTETENDLLVYLQRTLSKDGQSLAHVSWERVCSGSGIPNIYAYFRQSGIAEEDPAIAAQIAQVMADDGDITPIVMNNAMGENPCSLCKQTLNTFLGILGAEVGNMGLKILATGGIYLGGGIPPRLLAYLDEPVFANALYNKGRLSPVLRDMPVKVILNPKAALFGAAYYGLSVHS